MKLARAALVAGALAGASAVVLGAFGAHALRNSLDESALATWRTAVDYQFWHSLALLAVGVIARDGATRPLRLSAAAFACGIALFSGSLYALALGSPRGAGVITPIGGLAFIVGWIALAVHAWRHERGR
jgi:uncharacterized membrane protein YgdD (TMEM256/DUF423 family)